MKIYRSPRELLAEIKRVLTSKQSFHRSPLAEVTDLLSRGRRYTWMGIYLAVGAEGAAQHLLGKSGEPHPAQMARPETKSKVLVSIKVAGRELGVLDAESDQENAFGSDDRVLLERVANELARFLSGPGRYVIRKVRNGR